MFDCITFDSDIHHQEMAIFTSKKVFETLKVHLQIPKPLTCFHGRLIIPCLH